MRGGEAGPLKTRPSPPHGFQHGDDEVTQVPSLSGVTSTSVCPGWEPRPRPSQLPVLSGPHHITLGGSVRALSCSSSVSYHLSNVFSLAKAPVYLCQTSSSSICLHFKENQSHLFLLHWLHCSQLFLLVTKRRRLSSLGPVSTPSSLVLQSKRGCRIQIVLDESFLISSHPTHQLTQCNVNWRGVQRVWPSDGHH